MRDSILEQIVHDDARRLRRILKAVALGQRPDDLDPDELALVALHRDGLLVALGEWSRRVLESLVEELVSLGIGPAEAPERLDESSIASSSDFAEVVGEYVELLRAAFDESGELDVDRLDATLDDGFVPGVVDAPMRTAVAGELLCASVLIALLAPGTDATGEAGWIASDRRRHLRSLLVARAKAGTLPPPVAPESQIRRIG